MPLGAHIRGPNVHLRKLLSSLMMKFMQGLGRVFQDSKAPRSLT